MIFVHHWSPAGQHLEHSAHTPVWADPWHTDDLGPLVVMSAPCARTQYYKMLGMRPHSIPRRAG